MAKTSADYIRFSDTLEEIPADFDEHLKKIVSDLKDFIIQSMKVSKLNYYSRAAHAKGYAALKAKFTILDNLPEELSQGVYARPGEHNAIIRFSNGSAQVNIDKDSGNALGLAIEVLGVPGKKMTGEESEAPNMDFNLINHPIFFCNTSHDYIFIDKLFFKINEYFGRGPVGKLEFAYLWATEMGKAFPGRDTLRELKALLSFQEIKPQNPFLYDFYSMGAVRHGEYVAKVRAHPAPEFISKIEHAGVDSAQRDNFYGTAIIDEIRNQDFGFDIQVQLCKDIKKMPVEDLTVEWSQELSPFQTVARLYIPKQEAPDDGNFMVMENLSFTPFNTIEDNRPMGNLQMTRLKVYQQSSQLRHHLNGENKWEPRTIEEVFVAGQK